MSTLTYLDASVLIAAARGQRPVREAAMAILDDPKRTFATSVFLWLEIMPKPLYNRLPLEVAFYERVLRDARQPEALDRMITVAQEEARAHGLSALDALHIGAAVAAGAVELVTGEKRSKPIHRTKRVAVRTIRR